MNKFFKILGIVFLATLVGLGALLGYGSYSASKFDAPSKAYVDKVIPIIASSWSSDDVIEQASPQLRQVMQPEALKQTLLNLSKLGQLRQYDGAKGQANVSFTTQAGKVISATYVANATFENGAAQINIRVIQVNGQWMLSDFYFNSPSLL